jgi:predicted polyphosphate/ATP-dependent NAD kinase
MLGIPAGVKMHSAVFAISPKSAAELVELFAGGKTELRDAEIMDTDEAAYRRNELRMTVFGYARTPYEPVLVQQGKSLFQSVSEEKVKQEIAKFACEFINPEELYILGAGTTIYKIAELMGLGENKTLLGVDAVKNGRLVAKDLNERDLLHLLEQEKKARILVSPIGAQGFVFGRGNQQLSAEVIEKVGTENVIVLATPHKLMATPVLMIDTGNEELDEKLRGYISVVCGYRLAQRKEVRIG